MNKAPDTQDQIQLLLTAFYFKYHQFNSVHEIYFYNLSKFNIRHKSKYPFSEGEHQQVLLWKVPLLSSEKTGPEKITEPTIIPSLPRHYSFSNIDSPAVLCFDQLDEVLYSFFELSADDANSLFIQSTFTSSDNQVVANWFI